MKRESRRRIKDGQFVKKAKSGKILPPAGGSRLTSWVMWGDTSAAKKEEISVLLETALIVFLLLFRTNHRLIVSTFPKEISVLI